MSDTPFYDAIRALRHRGPRFFVPGHKGNPAAVPPLAEALAWDITEVDGADDLARPTGPLAESQANMARLYGAGATLYSAAGTTPCIQAMLGVFCRPGDAVVMARGCHVAAVRALALLGLRPVWVPLRAGRPQPADVAAALHTSGARVVYLTSMDYYGRLADVAGVAAVCQRAGATLLCDNAHGAHLRFLTPDAHPLTLGADAVCDSAHKTLPALTGAAMLHLRHGTLAAQARQRLNLFCSTSPSYPVLLSLDWCAGWLLGGGAAAGFAAAAGRVAALRRAWGRLCLPCDDALRLVLCPARAGRRHTAFAAAMLAAGVAPELDDGQLLVYMAGPFNRDEDYARLQAAVEGALTAAAAGSPQDGPPGEGMAGGGLVPETPMAKNELLLQNNLYQKSIQLQNNLSYYAADALLDDPLPAVALPVRQALFAPAETVPTAEAAGRVMAGLAVPCPPGVPLTLPGEVVAPAAAARYLACGISTLDVVK